MTVDAHKKDLPNQTPAQMAGAFEISLSFHFDAAHRFDAAPDGHRHGRLHGHSFEGIVWVAGQPDPVMGFVVDFDRLREAVAVVREALDHHLLNEVEGLAVPSLEHIAKWVFDRLVSQIQGVTRVEIRRPSIGESCVFRAL
jgi:6-pyruvoyltetrahydropterin/6-carboxytetrahydropterin synthase